MKKFISILLSLIVISSMLFAIPVSAAGGLTLSTETKSAKQGDTISIAVNVTSNSGFAFLTVTPKYDTNVLELSNTSNGTVCSGYTAGKNPVWNGNGINVTTKGTLVTFTFKIKDSASVGNTSVGVTVRQCYDANSEDVAVNAPDGKITITCKAHTYGSYSKVNDNQHKRTCSACGNVETTNHSWNGGVVDKNASCNENGNKKYTCTTCSAEKNETIAKTNNHSFGNWSVTKKAGCTTTGTESRTCSVCNKVETRNINAIGHNFGSWSVSKQATCTETGTETRKCSTCNATENRTINALGHSFSNPTVTKEPTCTETGIESGNCTRCGETTTNTIKAKGHKFGVWAETKAATCTEKGTEERKCSACVAIETREIEALGHNFENPTVVKEATISSTGLMEGKCKRCGEITSEIIPCSAKDEATGTEFETEVGVFQEGTQMTVKKIEKTEEVYETVKTALKEVSPKFEVYDISAILNGAEVQPNGKVKATFNIPEGYSNNVVVYFISDDGIIEKIDSIVAEDGKTITAELSHFSSYAVVDLEKDTVTDTNTDNNNTENSSNALIWIIMVVVAALIIAGVVISLIVIKRKKGLTE